MTGFLGPPGACDACGRACCSLDQVGIQCFHCHQGVFMGRRWWVFVRDRDGLWLATPRDDIDPAELEVERIRMAYYGTADASITRTSR